MTKDVPETPKLRPTWPDISKPDTRGGGDGPHTEVWWVRWRRRRREKAARR
jgi:hypothetical protein